MIYLQSYFTISDNSGARIVKCLHVFKRSVRKGAFPGDVILTSVKRYIIRKGLHVRSGDKLKAILIRTKKPVKRIEGVRVNFDINTGIILGDQKLPKGTRIFGPIFFEIRRLGYFKVVSLAGRAF